MNIKTFTKFFKNKTKYFLVFLILFSILVPKIYATTVAECGNSYNLAVKQLNGSLGKKEITQEVYQEAVIEANKEKEKCEKSASDYVLPEEEPESVKWGVEQQQQLATINNNNNSTDNTSIILEELPGLTDKDLISHFKNSGEDGFVYYINWIIRISIALGTIIAVASLVFGGFLYITTDNYLKKSSGKKLIENALTGLLLLLTSYVILGQINSDLLKINLNLKKINVTATEDGLLEWSTEEYDASGAGTGFLNMNAVDRELADKLYINKGKCYKTATGKKKFDKDANKWKDVYKPTDEDKRNCKIDAGNKSIKEEQKNYAVCVTYNVDNSETETGTEICVMYK